MNPRLDSLILAKQHILLLTHVTPDADAVGGLLGLGKALQTLGKTVVMACSDPIPGRYAMLPGYASIVAQVNPPVDLVIALDCADEKRIGRLYTPERWRNIALLNIDHHATNPQFGTVNWIDPTCVATAEMALDLIDQLGAPLDADIATCLLYGIVGDTQAFRTPNVTPQVLAKTIRLMQVGASLHHAIEDLFQRKPASLLKLWGHALNNLHVEGNLAWMALSTQNRRASGHLDTDGLQLTNLLLESDGIHVAAVFVETDEGKVKISLRSRNGVDISAPALELGGGGHPAAAGATVPGPLDAVTARVVARLKQT
jgi:phosphoesterase RecJ-like protein